MLNNIVYAIHSKGKLVDPNYARSFLNACHPFSFYVG